MDNLVVAAFSVFVNVKAFVLDAGFHTQSEEFLDSKEQQESAYRGPCVNYQDAKALYTQEMPSAAVEEASVCCQESGKESTQDTANAMY